MDMKTLTLIEEPTEEVERKKHICEYARNKANLSSFTNILYFFLNVFLQVLAEAEDEFERLLNEAE